MLRLLCPLDFWETADQLLCATQHGHSIVHSLNGNKEILLWLLPSLNCELLGVHGQQYHICLYLDHLLGSDERQTQDYIINYKGWSLSICWDHIPFLKWSAFNSWEFNNAYTQLDHIWLYFLWKNTVQWFDDICKNWMVTVQKRTSPCFHIQPWNKLCGAHGTRGRSSSRTRFSQSDQQPTWKYISSEHLYLIRKVLSMCH